MRASVQVLQLEYHSLRKCKKKRICFRIRDLKYKMCTADLSALLNAYKIRPTSNDVLSTNASEAIFSTLFATTLFL